MSKPGTVASINGAFTILLVEDNPKSVERPLRLVSEYLTGQAFDPEIICLKAKADVKRTISSKSVDVIVTDFKIEDGFSGEDVVKLVKASGLWTDVLFYSAREFKEEEVRKAVDYGFLSFLHDREIEGPLKAIIDRNLRRYNDIMYLRGLVISRIIDLELFMNELLTDYFKLPKDTADQFEDLIWGNADFSYGAKVKVMASLMAKQKTHASNNQINEFLKVFHSLGKERNVLAHCRRNRANPKELMSMGDPHSIDRRDVLKTLMDSRTAFERLEELRQKLGLAAR